MSANISLMLVGVSYLLGSIPPSYLIAKFVYKVDILKQGNGNLGGANSLRLFGKKVGVLVALLDILKGTAAVLIAQTVNSSDGPETGFLAETPNVMALAGFAAVFGHCFSIFLKFRGGKGGATTAGVILAIDPFSLLVVVIFWVLIVSSTRFTSLANLLAVFSMPPLMRTRTDGSQYVLLGYALAILLVLTHRENLSRMLAGTERKVGETEQLPG
ncbi:MAG: glycerol-3-phosphate 1-O-acyltransferase PlsY, partial [Candidatus Heimdallarchaeota archaeon]|nr:glycerol-3-phosphate 1-O-acyltransferase PlsY [Candidatus Heimdallarchaeota archaeon]